MAHLQGLDEAPVRTMRTKDEQLHSKNIWFFDKTPAVQACVLKKKNLTGEVNVEVHFIKKKIPQELKTYVSC